MEDPKKSSSLQNTFLTPDIYNDLSDYLRQRLVKKGDNKEITNTRIGDNTKGIYGGSYHIPDAEYKTVFLPLVYNHVFKSKKKEYLTEKQLVTGGPLVVDVDLRHDLSIDERQYTLEHVDDLIYLYLEIIKQIYQVDSNTKFPVFVFQKPSVNVCKEKDCTKDGIHILFGIKTDHNVQQIIRQKVIKEIPNIWKDLILKNSWNDVFDEGISKGTTNWQLFGSRKPGNERYALTLIKEVSFDPGDGEIICADKKVTDFDMSKNLYKLSVRNKENALMFMRNDFIANVYGEFVNQNKKTKANTPIVISQSRSNLFNDISCITSIKCFEELELLKNEFLDDVSKTINEYDLKTIFEYVNILPESYYGEGSYDKWLRVGWALKNTSDKGLLIWIWMSAKSRTFSYSSISDLCDKWRGFERRSQGGITKSSIIYWAKRDVYDEYMKIYTETVDYYIENILNTVPVKGRAPDYDLALVLNQMVRDEFVCVSIGKNEWFRFKNNSRWYTDERGVSLSRLISTTMRPLFNSKTTGFMKNISRENLEVIEHTSNIVNHVPTDDEENDENKDRTKKALAICDRLGNTADKQSIMKQAQEICYDDTFCERLDANPYLLGFENGVIDFKEKVFRKGHPEDCVSFSTKINYIVLTKMHEPIIKEINDFMDKLFPDENLRKYMWEHLASTLIGTSSAINQMFNNYLGIGSNGKSILIMLMQYVLGDYYAEVSPTLITGERTKMGGLQPELAQLKGIRLAVMNEPDKRETINEGKMKQYTSGKDQVSCRAPYQTKTMTYTPQFNLVVVCNALMNVKANDHGTWRRIRVVEFESLFTDNPVDDDPEKPYQYKPDRTIEQKFKDWAPVFASMLVSIVFKTDGKVNDVARVLSRSKEYQKSQDYISEFVDDRLVKASDKRVKKMELNNEFALWYSANYGGKGPSPKELHEYMNKEFGRAKNQVWNGVGIKYDNDMLNDDDVIDQDDIEKL